MAVAEAEALFPRRRDPILSPGSAAGPTGACSTRIEAAPVEEASVSGADKSASCSLRFEVVQPWREAVRRALSVLALPPHALLAVRLLYETVDAIWYAAGDAATDFSFYTKRATLAGIYTATLLYWLEDRSEGYTATQAFLDRRLAELRQLTEARRRFEAAATRLPNPARLLRPAR